MLTVILLVVLGGGIGLLAVTLADSQKTATNGGRSRRAETADDRDEPMPEIAPAAVSAGPAVPPRGAPPIVTGQPGDRRRPPIDPATVPPEFTAVEGAYADLVRPSMLRRAVSFVLIMISLTVVALLIAGLIGAGVTIVARLLNNAI